MSTHAEGLTHRYTQALDLARTLHTERRKGTDIPYLAHLLSVSALVLEHGGTEDQAIAALLHDSAEDHGGEARIVELRTQFGDEVADMVLACSDSLTDDKADKQPWWPRKVQYLDGLAHEPLDALVVSAADKVHNARSILGDYRLMGDDLWSRFNPTAGRIGSLWYYTRLVQILGERLAGTPAAELAAELGRTVDAIYAEATARGHDVKAELEAAEGKAHEAAQGVAEEEPR